MTKKIFLLVMVVANLISVEAYSASLFFSSKSINMDDGDSGYKEYGSPNHRGSYIAPVNGTCKVACRSSAAVQVDVESRCMCISGSKCFTIDIGYNGPMMTTNGTGIMEKDVNLGGGGRYQTHPGPGTTSYDNDAISMGIGANDKYGKWIHKARQCGAEGDPTRGGRTKTAGCIGVPCSYWPEVKSMAGKSMTVCNGNPEESTISGKGSGRSRMKSKSRGGTQ